MKLLDPVSRRTLLRLKRGLGLGAGVFTTKIRAHTGDAIIKSDFSAHNRTLNSSG